MYKESKSTSNLIKTTRYLIHIISLIIPYSAGIVFIDAFSKYYHIRKCETFDESSLSICSIINTHYILTINMAGIIFVISAIVLRIFKNYHQLNFIQINIIYLCFYTFLVSKYIKPELIILITALIFLLIYFMFIKSKININILKVTIIIFFLISLIYPFARGFKDFVYYYAEDKWISFSDFSKHNTGKEVWPKSIQTLLLGINELNLKDFSTIGIGYDSFIDAAAWPIRHVVHGRGYGYKRGIMDKRKSRWIVHRKLVDTDVTELNTMVFPYSRLNRKLEGDYRLMKYAKCKLKWASNGIYISYC